MSLRDAIPRLRRYNDPVKTAGYLPELASALAKGDVALWLSNDSKLPDDDAGRSFLARPQWIGVWSESENPSFATELVARWKASDYRRQIVEVPNDLTDVLGLHFAFADICPFMYMDGRAPTADALDEILREEARAAKVRQLSRIGAAVLVLDTSGDADRALKSIARAGRIAQDLRLLVVAGVDPIVHAPALDTFARKYPSVAAMLTFDPRPLVDVLRELDQLRIEPIATPTIRVGRSSLPLAELLRREPPITQDFDLLTERDVRDPDPEDSDEKDALRGLLRGDGAAWRCFAGQMEWQRDAIRPYRDLISRQIEQLGEGKVRVVRIAVPAEFGSGVTVLLGQLAYHTARLGCPTLIHRGATSQFNYNRLRAFLTDLYRDLEGPDATRPAVLVFDTDSVLNDAMALLRDLPARLDRDSRRVLVIQARPLRDDEKLERPAAVISRGVEELSGDVLRSAISFGEQASLGNWAKMRLEKFGLRLPVDWLQQMQAAATGARCPLLIAMSILLTDDWGHDAKLGARLIARLRRAHKQHSQLPVAGVASPTTPVVPSLKMGHTLAELPETDLADLATAMMVLAATSSLGLAVPSHVLSHLSGVPLDRILQVTAELQKCDLVSARIPEADPSSPSDDGRRVGALTSVAFYTEPLSFKLCHNQYGQLILSALGSNDGSADREFVLVRDIAKEICALAMKWEPGRPPRYPLSILATLFGRLKPGVIEHRHFAEEAGSRYLRIQRKGVDREFRDWQWKERGLIREAFSWLPEHLVIQSASLLHSHALTYSKVTQGEPWAQARPLYEHAEEDLISALELPAAEQSETPAHLLSSLGMIYLHWAKFALESGDPDHMWEWLDNKAEQTLREAQELDWGNSYPVYHLAGHRVWRVRRQIEAGGHDDAVAEDLAEAIELLSAKPEAYFEEDWNELFREAVGLLEGEAAATVIKGLQEKNNELGWALAALRVLGGQIPEDAVAADQTATLDQASSILAVAAHRPKVDRTALGEFLRYAIFSAHPDRHREPQYRKRFDLISKLQGTRYLNNPLWMFDLGMLCFQIGDFVQGAEVFRDLRRGQRFFNVPLDRSRPLAESPNSAKARQLVLKVIAVDSDTEKGWGRVVSPIKLPDAVPFSVRAVRSRRGSGSVFGGRCIPLHFVAIGGILRAGGRGEP